LDRGLLYASVGMILLGLSGLLLMFFYPGMYRHAGLEQLSLYIMLLGLIFLPGALLKGGVPSASAFWKALIGLSLIAALSAAAFALLVTPF